ncbi:CDP-diacylglycerol--serine O-phosphatidyltransferase [bacterium]|jgi:CDP-diacylglycerol---serine O-phosphatidyltransferase|nr:CDP-diacylglycerol--serine O-phosphatidyltransferase [bacterium]
MRHNKKTSLVKWIPFFFTFGNAFFGLLSIMYALDGNVVPAAYCIFFAAVMDGFDGRLARIFGVSSLLGVELDSLCDAISFCLAPAILLYSSFMHDGGITGIIVLAFYLCASLFRLAKFNLEPEKQGQSFSGLPTTIGAFFLATLVLYHDRVLESPLRFLVKGKSIIAVVVFIAVLMISSLPFPAFKKVPVLFSRLAAKLTIGLALALFALKQGIPLLFMVLVLYISAGIATGIYLYSSNFLKSRK